jgi:sugar lactone lactonase YvrE
MKAELITDAKATLGEGPAWDAKTQTLYWLDILQKRLYAGTELLAELESMVGCLAPCRNGHLILGARLGILDFEVPTGRTTVLKTLLDEPSNNRVNDGKCDPAGRFLLGSMDMVKETDPTGALYSFDGRGLTRLFDGLVISNGLAWSPDHKTFYHIDTPTRLVKAYDYDVSTGALSRPRVLVRVPVDMGWPDGMTSDLEGNLWIAMWGGAKVTRWSPNGTLLDSIPVPALNTTACVFGGKDRNELYLTSARKDMSDADLAEYPLSGGLFRVVTTTTGMETFQYGQA